jgi:hypothetical protein
MLMNRLILSSILLVACGTSSPGPSQTPGEPAGVDSQDMLQHFVRVAALERAVIDDDLDEARTQATEIMKARTGDPEEWAPYVGYLHRAAESVLSAPDMTQAAIATATVVGQCGRCHIALGVELSTDIEDTPPDTTLEEKMRRHQWSTDVLRTAIVFSSDELWQRGAETLADSPLDASEVSDDESLDPGVAVHVRDLRQLANLAVAASPDERQGTYGAILRTCANCHIDAR